VRDFWFTAVAIVLCGIVAMCLLVLGLDLSDDVSEIPPRTKADGTLVQPPGFVTG
jgi:hypothetical protein